MPSGPLLRAGKRRPPPAQPDPEEDDLEGDKVTVTVERIDGGKLRCSGATWAAGEVISGPSRRSGLAPPISVR
jgi:hypothetical protein